MTAFLVGVGDQTNLDDVSKYDEGSRGSNRCCNTSSEVLNYQDEG
jgi:hypothetical protein